jgi:ligand-binding sensor domain-containing protein/signal transduction histidine kinase
MSRASLCLSRARSGGVACARLVTVVLAGGAALAAQTPEPPFGQRSWDERDGLPGTAISAIRRTSYGYLWLGTRSGLVRFDGARFKVFDSQNLPQLRTNGVTSLLAQSDGRLWAGTPDGLFYFQDGKPGAPELIEVGNHLAVKALAAGAAGTVWALAASNQLVRVVGGKVEGRIRSPGGVPIRTITSDASGRLVAASSNALYSVSNGQLVEWPGQGAGEIRDVTASRTGYVWVASSRAARRINEAGDLLVARADPVSKTSPRAPITDLLEDRAGRLWAGAFGGGIYCFQAEGGWREITPRRPRSLGSITCLYEDSEDSIWASTSAGILHQLRPRLIETWSLPTTAPENVPHTVCLAQDRSLWIGTDGAGAYRYRAGDVSHFGREEGLSSATVLAILEDQQTNLWFGTYSGLFRLENGRFKPELTPSLSRKPVPALFQDRAGDLWIGTAGAVLRKRGEEVKIYDLGRAAQGYEVRALAEGPPGQLWIGVRGAGLFRLRNDRVQKEGNLGLRALVALHSDQSGALWIGVLNNGLFRLQGRTVRRWATADGLPSNALHAIQEDDADNLWFSSNDGVFAVNKRVLDAYQPGQSAPLASIHLTASETENWSAGSGQPAAARSPDGRLWFPMGHGVVSFSPAALTRSRPVLPVLIDEVRVDGVAQSFRAASSLRVPSGARRLEFGYTVADLDAPGRLKFRYRLEGWEDRWVDAGIQRAASYGSLPVGHYRFQVAASGSQGIWNELASPLAVEVVPRLWERRWFQALSALAILGAVAGIARGVERAKVGRKMERLELQQTMERERQRIARDLHDDLGAGLTEIMLLGEVANREGAPAAETQHQLAIITDKARRLAAAMDEVVWTVNPKNDLLPNLASYMCDYAREFFRAASARCRIDMAECLPPSLLPAQARHNLFLAVKEALNNAAKHSGAGEVWLRIRCEGSELLVAVEDNGRGFDPAAANPPRNGLGNMRARLEAAGGRVEIASQPGCGTTVRFFLPLPAPA